MRFDRLTGIVLKPMAHAVGPEGMPIAHHYVVGMLAH